jgi:hypothetical protein
MNTHRLITKLFLIFVCIALLPLTIFAQPSEESLLEAWENLQRSDPKTVVFEKIKERNYRFKTERFPFDGELKVLEVIVDDNYSDMTGTINGIVNVKLVGLDRDTISEYSYGYGRWEQNNYLVYDIEAKEWISSIEYTKRASSEAMQYQSQDSLFKTFDYALLILLVVGFVIILIIYWLYMRKHSNQLKDNKKYMETSLALNEKSLRISEEAHNINKESNELLKDILEELKRQKKENL